MTTPQIAWAAGLLEGEGCFKKSGASPSVVVAMTDRDAVDKIAALWGSEATVWTRRGPLKTPYFTAIYGGPAVGWMMTIYSFLGSRRQAKIRELIADWRSRKNTFHENAVCSHIERKHAARGMCGACYDKYRYLRRKESSLE